MTEPTSLPSSADVVIVGAGLAGLSAAWELTSAGVHTVLLEAGERPGGRIRTDVVDGFRLDRGFQLLNPSYPRLKLLAARGALDFTRLRLQPFDPGVRVALEGRTAIVADPLRSPKDALASLRAPVGSMTEKLAFAAWASRCAVLPARRLTHAPDRPYGETLDHRRISGRLRKSVVEPFLTGVLAEDEAQTSTRFAELIIRSFVRGTPAVPAWGMHMLPEQLAAALPPSVLALQTRALRVQAGLVQTDHGPIRARAVLVATEPRAAAELTGIAMPLMRALSTFWFVADQSPCSRTMLSLDGLRRGPIVNSAVLSDAAPAYSPDGRALIGCTILGLPGPDTEAQVRRQAALIYPNAAALARGRDDTGEQQSPAQWQLLRVDAIAEALPSMLAPLQLRQPVRLEVGLYVAGDHRDTASQQGALASGARAAHAIESDLGLTPTR